MHGRRLTFFLAVLTVLAGCVSAPPPRPLFPSPAEPEVQAPTAERWILVRKADRLLFLYERGLVIRTYPVVLGRDPSGPKRYEGDRRTPEGEYHISNKYFHPYWSRFMLLDYPTPANRETYAWTRTHGLLPERGGGVPGIGGAVGIHGAEDEGLNRRGVDWTLGCISLFNDDIDELYDLVPVGTRVRIEP